MEGYFFNEQTIAIDNRNIIYVLLYDVKRS